MSQPHGHGDLNPPAEPTAAGEPAPGTQGPAVDDQKLPAAGEPTLGTLGTQAPAVEHQNPLVEPAAAGEPAPVTQALGVDDQKLPVGSEPAFETRPSALHHQTLPVEPASSSEPAQVPAADDEKPPSDLGDGDEPAMGTQVLAVDDVRCLFITGDNHPADILAVRRQRLGYC